MDNPIKEEGSDEDKAGQEAMDVINKQLQDIEGQIDIENPKKDVDQEKPKVLYSNTKIEKPKIKVLSSSNIQFQSSKQDERVKVSDPSNIDETVEGEQDDLPTVKKKISIKPMMSKQGVPLKIKMSSVNLKPSDEPKALN